MSSEISTDQPLRAPDAASGGSAHSTSRNPTASKSRAAAGNRPAVSRLQQESGLEPWQLFVLAALGCATAVTFLVRSQGAIAVILLSVMMGATALVGLAMLRTVRPLVSAGEDRTVVIGHRTRAALEREKSLTLRTIKELEFDRAMGKVSDDDFRDMTVTLRARATRLIRQLDASDGYRTMIERDLSKRLGAVKAGRDDEPEAAAPRVRQGERACGNCSTANDGDARFCKSCGAKL
jgi:hypothetical protein